MDLGSGLRLVIFDFDGTLIDLDVDWAAVRRRLGIEGTTETIGAAMERLMVAGDPAVDEVTAEELAALGDRTVGISVLSTLDGLAGRFDLAICTRNSREVVLRAFADAPVLAAMHIVGREDTRRLKPDPEAVHKVLALAGARSDEAVLVGDTSHDVLAARAAGIASVVVANKRLAYPPTGADQYIETIGDLPRLLQGTFA